MEISQSESSSSGVFKSVIESKEPKTEVILSEDVVNNLFDNLKVEDPYNYRGTIKTVTEYIHGDWICLKEEELEKKRDDIVKLADQLPEELSVSPAGARIEYAYYRKGTDPINIKKTYDKWKQDNSQGTWTKNIETRNKLLALINAIGLGSVNTASVQRRYNPQADIRFLIDIGKYHQIRGDKPGIHKIK
jgi:hypothetical protein